MRPRSLLTPLAVTCLALGFLGCRACGKTVGSATSDDRGACVETSTGTPATKTFDRADGYPERFVSDGTHLYVIELLDSHESDGSRYQIVRVPLRGGPRTTLIASQPDLYPPLAIAGSFLVVQSGVAGGVRLRSISIVNHDLTTGRQTPVRLPAGVEGPLQVHSLHVGPKGQVTAVAHDAHDGVILRWDPATAADVDAVLLARIPREAESGFLDQIVFDGSKFVVLRNAAGRPSRVTAMAGSSEVLEVTAPAESSMVGAVGGRAYVVRFDDWKGKGEDSVPTSSELDVIDDRGLQVVSHDLYLPASVTIRDGYFYALRLDSGEKLVRFRRRIDGTALGREEVLEEGADSADEFVFDRCSVMWLGSAKKSPFSAKRPPLAILRKAR